MQAGHGSGIGTRTFHDRDRLRLRDSVHCAARSYTAKGIGPKETLMDRMHLAHPKHPASASSSRGIWPMNLLVWIISGGNFVACWPPQLWPSSARRSWVSAAPGTIELSPAWPSRQALSGRAPAKRRTESSTSCCMNASTAAALRRRADSMSNISKLVSANSTSTSPA
jgi:hypothetical protein